jgi:hypothetical protein
MFCIHDSIELTSGETYFSCRLLVPMLANKVACTIPLLLDQASMVKMHLEESSSYLKSARKLNQATMARQSDSGSSVKSL